MTKDIVKKAFDFYDINDKDYEKKLEDTIDVINADQILKEKVLNLVDILFIKYEDRKFGEIINLSYSEYFKSDNLFITNIIILLGLDTLKRSISKFDDEMQKIYKEKIKSDLLLYKNGMPLRHTTWLAHYITGHILEIGCLVYQIMDEPYLDCKVKVHIPRDVKFDINNIKKSLRLSKEYVKRYFDIDNPKYFCNSWMLSSTTRACLNKESNIYKFGNLFDIKEEYPSLDVLRFVFQNNTDNYKELDENTSLQRKLKEKLINGEALYNAIGILK